MKRKFEYKYLSIQGFHDSIYKGLFGTNILNEYDFAGKKYMEIFSPFVIDGDHSLIETLMKERIFKSLNYIIINRPRG